MRPEGSENCQRMAPEFPPDAAVSIAAENASASADSVATGIGSPIWAPLFVQASAFALSVELAVCVSPLSGSVKVSPPVAPSPVEPEPPFGE